ncbi:uncharacterized protein NtR [Drosophila bipectinata]|uniref:uncharacterized protein NtR n=1 Tax=Drosophila bipectinata TaxID=42026 RepID=UPI001C8A4FF8|nr:uncharacterized protein LOC108125225 [Drosophila bipectinata]
MPSWLITCLALGWLCLVPSPSFAEPPNAPKSRYNITFAQLDTCDSYSIGQSGYAYRDFFMVHSLDNNKARSGERLHLKFYVLTSMDAHILLSVTDRLRPTDRVYEIVIGAGGNTFSAIRTAMGLRRVATNQDRNLLSVYEPTPIEIVQTQNAELFVYIPGFKKEPLLQFVDSSALNINYISFSSFGSNTARWFYDCGFDGFDNELSPDKPEPLVEQKLLDYINLRGEKASQPGNLSSLKFHFRPLSVAYEPENSWLHSTLNFILHWQDDRLSWKPSDYGHLESFEHRDLKIWTPQMYTLNGADYSLQNLLQYRGELRVYSNGNVTMYLNKMWLTNRCVDTARNWPRERVTCDIQLGVIGEVGMESLPLIYDDQRSPVEPNEHVNTPSGWTFNDISVQQVVNGSQSRYSPKHILQAMAGDVVIEFTMQRNSQFYMSVFFVPLAACQIFVILSFVLRSTRRSALILISLLITAWALMYITRHAPPFYVPALMSDFKVLMMVATYCYILHIAIMWLELYPPQAKAPNCLLTVMNSNVLRFVLGLRLADSSVYCDVQEKPWPHLAKILNNLSSIVVIITFAIQDATSI